MVSRHEESDKVPKKKAAAAKTPATRQRAAKAAPAGGSAASSKKAAPAADPAPAGPKGLLHASLKALGNVRDDVVMRQNNVIDSLLGMAPGKGAASADAKGVLPRGLKALDPFGIRKFEDVFDQRVATALQHLGLPTAEEFKALQDEVKRLREQLEQSQPTQPKAAPTTRRRR